MKSPSNGRPVEILLVEDNPGDVRFTEEVLKDASVRNHLSIAKDGVEGDVVVSGMRGLTRRRPGGIERGVQRALRASSRPNPLEECLCRHAGFLFPPGGQLFDLAPQFRVVGTLHEQRLVDTQRVLLMALFEVQLRHGLREHGLRL